MNAKARFFSAALAAALCAGCASYRWIPSVPEDRRTVAVPEFMNETAVPGLGAAVTRQTLREFQREGTFKIRRQGDAAIEVQGVLKRTDRTPLAYDRNYGMRASEYRMAVYAEVSFVDKTAGTVLADNRRYTAETTFSAGHDLLTGERNATERLALDLARQIAADAVETVSKPAQTSGK